MIIYCICQYRPIGITMLIGGYSWMDLVKVEEEEYPFSIYDRALQLWKMANQMFTTSPTISQSYIRQLITMCTAHNFPPSNTFYLHVCSVCGILWYPDITMTMRVWRYSKIRAAMRSDKNKRKRGIEGSERGEYRLMSTILMPNDTAPKLKGKDKINAKYPVYECLCCGYRSIFDIYPVTKRKPKEEVVVKQESLMGSTKVPAAPLPVPGSDRDERRKMAQLQRILQRSSSKQSNSNSNNNTTGLSSFLSGLNPGLFKK